MCTFENIMMTEMEMQIHAHAATLTPAQLQDNEERSKPVEPSKRKAMDVTHINPDNVEQYRNLPNMVMPPS